MRKSSHSLSNTAGRCVGLALGLLAIAPASAQDDNAPFATETIAREAIIIDGETGAVLLEKNADAPFPPASLAKIMTMAVVFQALKDEEITPATMYPVTNYAWRTGGAPSRTSTMFAAVRSKVPVDALVRGVIVHAANDGAIVLAEGMSGSEEAFAGRMNERAKALGLSGSTFVNPTGLPADGQAVTARDLATLARHVLTTYPDWYALYAQPEFSWNDILQRNRNPLLRRDLGATGMATGFADGSGFSIVGVTQKSGRTTVIALGGLESDAVRTKEAERLFKWTETSFRRAILFSAGRPVGAAKVFGGIANEVPFVLGEDLAAFVPSQQPDLVTASVAYDGPLQAPIEKGERIGQIEIRIDGKPAMTRDLFAGEDVSEGTFSMKALDAAQELAFGWIRSL